MRSPLRRRQDIWFASGEETRSGIDNVMVYGKPEKHRFTVSATSGYPFYMAFGFQLDYERTITSFERDFFPPEGTYCWVDVEPELDDEGELVISDDGVNPVTPPDYQVQRLLNTEKALLGRYGIKKVGA